MLLWKKIIGLDLAMSYYLWQELGYNLKRPEELGKPTVSHGQP